MTPYTSGGDAPGYTAEAVTPDNSNDLAEPARFLFINAAGAVRFTPAGNADGAHVTWSFAAGTFVPMRVKRVYATGTTVAAGNIFACR